jgi:dihydroneopterin aldolase
MLNIHLHNLEFFASHGLHDGEELTGGRFLVSLDIELKVSHPVSELSQSLDYGKAYEVVKKIMLHRELLLEIVAENIVAEIRSLHSGIKKIHVSIKKMNPPIKGFQGEVGVSVRYEY